MSSWATLLAGTSARRFYERLATALAEGLWTPEWCWCVTARVVGAHEIGEDKVSVRGSRHFAPGTRVYFADAFWSQGGERCTVVGVPKYSSRPVGVTMRTDLLVDFRFERASDPDVVRALVTDRLGGRFVRARKTVVSGRWACSEKDRQDAERIAEILSARAGAR